jgi:hypothetical protein
MGTLARFSGTLVFVICAGLHCRAQTAIDFQGNYLTPLMAHNTPIIYAQCSYNGGKVMIILPLGESEWRFVELAWGKRGSRSNPALANEGRFAVGAKVVLKDLLMGGPAAYRFQAEIIENLLKAPLLFVYPKDLYSIIDSAPAVGCEPSP